MTTDEFTVSNSFYLISCGGPLTTVRENLLPDVMYQSIYRVSGPDSWLIFKTKGELNTGNGSVNWQDVSDFRTMYAGQGNCVAYLIKEFNKPSNLEPTNLDLRSFIWIRPPSTSVQQSPPDLFKNTARQLLKLLTNPGTRRNMATLHRPSLVPRRLYLLEGSPWFFMLEVITPGIDALGSLIDPTTRRHFDTLTKCVLVHWKHHGVWETYKRANDKRENHFDTKPNPDCNYRIAAFTRNNRNFFLSRVEEQVERVSTALRTLPVPSGPRVDDSAIREQLEPTISGDYIYKHQLTPSNPYVSRYTLRPIKEWGFTFIFLQAPAPQDSKLFKAFNECVGVKNSYIIPRIYKMSGDFDYLLPVYTRREAARYALQSRFKEYSPLCIECFLPGEKEEDYELLTHTSVTLLQSVLRTAIWFDTFKEELVELDKHTMYLRNLEGAERTKRFRNFRDPANFAEYVDEIRRWVSPRTFAVYQKTALPRLEKGQPEGAELLIDVLHEWDSLVPTWEFTVNPGCAAFVRLRPRADGKAALMDTITGLLDAHEIAFDMFETEESEVVGIARFTKLADLNRFLSRVRDACERVNFDLMLGTVPVSWNLEEDSECRPCLFPKTPTFERTPELDCTYCARYVRKSGLSETQKLRVELDPSVSRRLAPVQVGILDLRIGFEELPLINASPVLERDTKVEEFGEGAAWRCYNDTSIGDDLWNLISKGPLCKADIVVLPEYCVPLDVAKMLLMRLQEAWASKRKQQRLLVLGSHLDPYGYNTCPVVWMGKQGVQVFLQQKNQMSEDEVDHGIVLHGDASYMFRTPKWGNITVQICLDSHKSDWTNERDADIVLIPAFHPGKTTTLPKKVGASAELTSRLFVFANGARTVDAASEGNGSGLFPAHQKGIGKGKVEVVDIGGFEGYVTVSKIDLAELDYARARARGPKDVFPLHVDFWKAHKKRELETELDQRLQVIGKMANKHKGKIEEYLSVDWEAAKSRWVTASHR